jgi:hypothetical protein
MVAVVAANAPRILASYQALIEVRAPFPPELHASDGPAELHPIPAGFPKQGQATHDPGAAPTGAGPSTPEQWVDGEVLKFLDPRVPLGAPPLMTQYANGTNVENTSLEQEVQTGEIRS